MAATVQFSEIFSPLPTAAVVSTLCLCDVLVICSATYGAHEVIAPAQWLRSLILYLILAGFLARISGISDSRLKPSDITLRLIVPRLDATATARLFLAMR